MPRTTTPKAPKRYALAVLLASEFGRSAGMFAQLARELEASHRRTAEDFLKQSAYVNSSIIASGAFLESLINDVLTHSGQHRSRGAGAKVRRRISTMWALGVPRTAGFPILQKYQVALALTDAQLFETGTQPFQDAQSVVALRNELVHHEPVIQPADGDTEMAEVFPIHRLVARLKNKFTLNPICHESAPVWPTKLLGAGCASWAVSAAVDFVEEFARRLPLEKEADYMRQVADAVRAELRPDGRSNLRLQPTAAAVARAAAAEAER